MSTSRTLTGIVIGALTCSLPFALAGCDCSVSESATSQVAKTKASDDDAADAHHGPTPVAEIDLHDPEAGFDPNAIAATFEYEIEGMHCKGCASSVRRRIARLPGVANCTVDLETKRAVVELEEPQNDAAIRSAILRLGYKIRVPIASADTPKSDAFDSKADSAS
ncbi:MAG: heavy-metal-associated domain-containing protein [Phycisphaeraceae bacterium]|nr:heavy-metal-associated domain-containing protein [Phycisphaeraceae bacterium]